jgi:hypothetical protein
MTNENEENSRCIFIFHKKTPAGKNYAAEVRDFIFRWRDEIGQLLQQQGCLQHHIIFNNGTNRFGIGIAAIGVVVGV